MHVSTKNSNRRPLASINITPLVDVLLILLVVLMLAMPMFVKRLPVDLPVTDLAGAPTPMQSLAVSVLKDGRIQVKDSPTDLTGLAVRITPTTTVELSVDKEVSYETLAKVVVAIQAKSPKEIILITR